MQNEQTPLAAGFNADATAQEVMRDIDLSGKTAIVTGGHSGLGLVTTRALVDAGAEVIVPARSLDKARHALAGVPRVALAEMDLLDPLSVRTFAETFAESGRPLHLLINSAGVMATPLRRDARGNEAQFSANHLGHFQLAMRLWPALRRAGGARVVAISSRAHQFAGVDFEDPNFLRRPYDKWLAYAQSKTANALFAVALDRRGEATGVRAFSLHPGSIVTGLAHELDDAEFGAFGLSRQTPHGYVPPGKGIADGGDYKTLEQGAATALWCASSPALEGLGGLYCENVDIAPMTTASDRIGDPGVRPWATDPELAERLWSLSEAVTGLVLPPSA